MAQHLEEHPSGELPAEVAHRRQASLQLLLVEEYLLGKLGFDRRLAGGQAGSRIGGEPALLGGHPIAGGGTGCLDPLLGHRAGFGQTGFELPLGLDQAIERMRLFNRSRVLLGHRVGSQVSVRSVVGSQQCGLDIATGKGGWTMRFQRDPVNQ